MNTDWMKDTGQVHLIRAEFKSYVRACSVAKLCLSISHHHGLSPTRLLCLWDLPNQGLNLHYQLWQEDFLFLSFFLFFLTTEPPLGVTNAVKKIERDEPYSKLMRENSYMATRDDFRSLSHCILSRLSNRDMKKN